MINRLESVFNADLKCMILGCEIERRISIAFEFHGLSRRTFQAAVAASLRASNFLVSSVGQARVPLYALSGVSQISLNTVAAPLVVNKVRN